MYRRVAITFSLLAGVACSSTPEVAPLRANAVMPAAGEQVVVDHAYLVVDSSSSVEDDFATQKAMVQSFVGAMPDGTFQTGAVAFGGYDRINKPLDGDRAAMRSKADDLAYLSEGTPLDRVFGEVGNELSGKGDKAAVVVFSDGEPTDPVGRDLDHQQVLEAAKEMAGRYNGEVCIHTVQVGDSAEGSKFLRELANVTPCGTTRAMGSIQNVAALQNFEREVFMGAVATRAVAAAPGDEDQDGVLDADDRCPGTPRGAQVDARGCWSIPNLEFAFDSAEIRNNYQPDLNSLADVLKANPGVSVQIQGHTDSTGPEAYNEGLSQRRADSVRSYLVKQGVDGSRLSTKGFGESKPAYPNDTKENRQHNRRTELVRP